MKQEILKKQMMKSHQWLTQDQKRCVYRAMDEYAETKAPPIKKSYWNLLWNFLVLIGILYFAFEYYITYHKLNP